METYEVKYKLCPAAGHTLFMVKVLAAHEVKYKLCPTLGNAIVMTNTIETSSPEDARRMAYNMLRRSKQSKAKIKFMYVRKVKSSNL